MPFRNYSNFEKCKIAREKKSDVILLILSFYGAPHFFALPPLGPSTLKILAPPLIIIKAKTQRLCLIARWEKRSASNHCFPLGTTTSRYMMVLRADVSLSAGAGERDARHS